MNTPDFLFDENIPVAIATQLHRHAPQVKVYKIGEAPAPSKGTLDLDILLWLEENYCWLITNNRTSMPGHLFDHMNAGHHIPGIMIVPDPLNVGEVLAELILIWGASLPGEYKDRIVYLPVSR